MRWKMAVSLIAASACLLCAFGASAQDGITIKIDRLSGTVEVWHETATKAAWSGASAGQKLGEGWRLRTGKQSKVQLVFPLDNVVILKENSVLTIDKLDDGGGAGVSAKGGGLLADLKNALSPGSKFEVKTPSALAVVRGTKFAAAEITDESATFYGYRGEVEISNDFGTELLTADTSIDTVAGQPPAPARPSGPDASAFLAELEETESFDAQETAAQDVLRRLARIERALDRADDTLASYEEEWSRYLHRDQKTKLIFLYAEVLVLKQGLDDHGEELQALRGDYESTETWGQPSGLEDVSIGGYAQLVEAKLAALLERIAALSDDAEPYVDDNQDLLDRLLQLIPPGNPALGLRFKLLDTDGDGLSDVDEVELGLDPAVDNSADGFITLLEPEDGAEYEYLETPEITFEFEPLEGELVEQYDLAFEGDGRQLLLPHVDPATQVPLGQLVGAGAPFHDLLAAGGAGEISWQVLARLKPDQLFQPVGNQAQPPQGPSSIASLKRLLRILPPQQAGTIVVDLAVSGPAAVTAGQPLVIEGSISEVAALGEWEIEITFDPDVLSFRAGRKLGLFNASTVFFSPETSGVVTVSGSTPRNTPGISGEGLLFSLEFDSLAPGETTVEVRSVNLKDAAGSSIEAEPGESAEVEVRAGASANRQNDGRGKDDEPGD